MNTKLLEKPDKGTKIASIRFCLASFAITLMGLTTICATAQTPPSARAQIIGKGGEVLSEVSDLRLPQALSHCHCKSPYTVVARAMFSDSRRVYFFDSYEASPKQCPQTLTVNGIYVNGSIQNAAPLPIRGKLERHNDGTYAGLVESMNYTPYLAIQVWNIRLQNTNRCPK